MRKRWVASPIVVAASVALAACFTGCTPQLEAKTVSVRSVELAPVITSRLGEPHAAIEIAPLGEGDRWDVSVVSSRDCARLRVAQRQEIERQRRQAKNLPGAITVGLLATGAGLGVMVAAPDASARKEVVGIGAALGVTGLVLLGAGLYYAAVDGSEVEVVGEVVAGTEETVSSERCEITTLTDVAITLVVRGRDAPPRELALGRTDAAGKLTVDARAALTELFPAWPAVDRELVGDTIVLVAPERDAARIVDLRAMAGLWRPAPTSPAH